MGFYYPELSFLSFFYFNFLNEVGIAKCQIFKWISIFKFLTPVLVSFSQAGGKLCRRFDACNIKCSNQCLCFENMVIYYDYIIILMMSQVKGFILVIEDGGKTEAWVYNTVLTVLYVTFL